MEIVGLSRGRVWPAEERLKAEPFPFHLYEESFDAGGRARLVSLKFLRSEALVLKSDTTLLYDVEHGGN